MTPEQLARVCESATGQILAGNIPGTGLGMAQRNRQASGGRVEMPVN